MECSILIYKFVREGNLQGALGALEVFEQLKSNAKDIGVDDEGVNDTGRQNLWARLSKHLSGKKEGEDDTTSDDEEEKDVVSLLSSEDQFTHLQTLRKDLTHALLAEMRHGACPHCKRSPATTRKDGENVKILLDNFNPTNQGYSEDAPIVIRRGKKKSTSTFVTPSKVFEHLKKVWYLNETQQNFLESMYSARTVKGLTINGPEMFFIEAIPVPPNRFRPVMEVGSIKSEHPHTTIYKRVVMLNLTLSEVNSGKKEEEAAAAAAKEDGKKKFVPDRISLLVELQRAMNELIMGGGLNAPPGVKQELEKKQGLFRKHMMGKRVNFAARSVISPDPYIDTNEIGLPLYFCRKLSYPEPVTARNVERLRHNVINGPNTYPGANYIEDEYGNLIDLRLSEAVRKSEAARLLTVDAAAPRKYKTVYRHLRDGDMALVNRQPTLHKPGIMGHSVRVLENERTIRMHYSNCNTYNADFDGDEMNIHVPQGEMARAEARIIAYTDNQYLVPKDGSPLRGLIQDSVFSGVLLTKRDTFFIRTEFQQLLYGCLFNINTQHSIVTPMPTILKPKRLWTGKQIVNEHKLFMSYSNSQFQFIFLDHWRYEPCYCDDASHEPGGQR